MKSGTTSLFSCLSQHSRICPSVTKEPGYFCKTVGKKIKTKKYEEIFDYDDEKHEWCLEASTGYTKFPMEVGVPKRMKQYGINPYFIYSVRNPIDRIESQYNFAKLYDKNWRPKDILDIKMAHISMYYMQVREFLREYPDKSRYFIVDFEDIVNEKKDLLNKLINWLGLNNESNVYKKSKKNVTPDPSRIEHSLSKTKISWSKLFPSRAKRYLSNMLRNLDKPAKRTLNNREKSILHEWLKVDINRFKDEFDICIEKWGF